MLVGLTKSGLQYNFDSRPNPASISSCKFNLNTSYTGYTLTDRNGNPPNNIGAKLLQEKIPHITCSQENLNNAKYFIGNLTLDLYFTTNWITLYERMWKLNFYLIRFFKKKKHIHFFEFLIHFFFF